MAPYRKMRGIFDLKITKKHIFFKSRPFGAAQVGIVEQWYIFEKGAFRSGPGRDSGLFRGGPGQKNGAFRAAHTHTALIWEYPTPGVLIFMRCKNCY